MKNAKIVNCKRKIGRMKGKNKICCSTIKIKAEINRSIQTNVIMSNVGV